MSLRDTLEDFSIEIGDYTFEASEIDRQTAIGAASGIALIAIILAVVAGGPLMGALGIGFDHPDGADSDGINDADAIFAQHQAALTEDGYTIELTSSQEVDGEEQAMEQTHMYDASQERVFLTSTREGMGDDELYVAGDGPAFVKTDTSEGDVQYQKFPDEGVEDYTDHSVVRDRLAPFEYEYTGTTEYDGKTVGKYEIAGFAEEQGQEVSDRFSIEGEVLIDSDGVVWYIHTEGTDHEQGATFTETIEVVSMGQTSVEEPDWLDTAREEAQEPQPMMPPEEPDGEQDNTEDSDEEEETSDEESTDEESTDEESTDENSSE